MHLELFEQHIPGPFTFLIMLRLVSSINSTRTCVTPPREPVFEHYVLAKDASAIVNYHRLLHTSSTQHSCDLHQLDGNLASIHIDGFCSQIEGQKGTLRLTRVAMVVQGRMCCRGCITVKSSAEMASAVVRAKCRQDFAPAVDHAKSTANLKLFSSELVHLDLRR